MSDSGSKPMMQKVLENPFLLLFAGIVVMVVFYTAWGMIEIINMPEATLP